MDMPLAPERLSLMDLPPKKVVVSLARGDIEVGGLSAEDVVGLMEKHVALQKYMMRVPVTVAEIFQSAPSAIAAIIAAGCGERGNVLAEQAAASLTIEEQSEILEGIAGCTFTRGFGPFVRRIGKLGAEVEFGPTAAGRGQDMPSPRPSRPSEAPPIRESGNLAPDNSPPMPSSETEIASAA